MEKKYTQSEVDARITAVKAEYEQMLARQRERIDALRKSLADAEKEIKKYESQKQLVYKAITAALKKADDIERVSLIKYNQEIAQLKSFHAKWVGYFNRIVAAYPLDDELVEASRVNGRIAEVLDKTGNIDEQYARERDRLAESLEEESEEAQAQNTQDRAAAETAAQDVSGERDGSDYSDRSPSGFSFAEALHPKDDLKDIMRELGIIIDD